MQSLASLKMLQMNKSKKLTKKWPLNIILIEIEINPKFNNKRPLKCLGISTKPKMF